jgi:hypothetical protein
LRSALAAGATLFTITLAGMASAASTPHAPAPPPELPRAEIVRPIGVSPDLDHSNPGDRARVAVILDDQPVLRETTSSSFEAALSGYTRGDLQRAARRSPDRIADAEATAARAAERRRTAVVSELRDEVAELEAAQRPVERAIEGAGGDVVQKDLAASGALAVVTARLDTRDLDELADHRSVQAIVPAPKPEPQLDTSTTTISAASVFPQHSGGGDDDYGGAADVRTDLEVGMGGDSPNPAHAAFSGISIDNGSASGGPHGTATTGVIASRDSTFRGVAPGTAEVRGGTADTWASPDPVETRNESFGYEPISDDSANVADLSANSFLVPWAASAGNFNDDVGVTPGSPTTGGDAMGRNILSVGAIADISTVAPEDDAVAAYSSWGPTPQGRKKPDLVAPGTAITTTSVGGGFGTETGTSLASPHVAGALAVLAGAGMTDPRAMRATLVNSARPWCNGHVPGHDPPQGPALPDDPNYGSAPGAGACQVGWEPDVGWGELDVADAVAQRGNSLVGDVEAGKARFYAAEAEPGERVTLAWNLRGVLGPDVTQHVYFAVTDLNLRQYRPDGTPIASPADAGWGAGPDAVDPNDTVEQVRAPTPAGEIILKVSADSTVEGQDAERFGLASANALTPLESPDVNPVDVSQSGSGPISCSQTVTVTARLANPSSDIEASPASLSLELPTGLELVSGTATQSVSGGTLDPDKTSEAVSWTVRPTSSGTHALRVRGDGTAYGTTFSNLRRLAPITADCSPPRVDATGLAVSPSPEVECGQPQTLTTAFRNPTLTDAVNARAELSLTNAELVSGTAAQTVAGGTLPAGTTSSPHSWQVRVRAPSPSLIGTATATVTARTDASSVPSTAQVTLRCSRPAVPPPSDERATVRLASGRLVSRDDGARLVAKGRLDGSTTAPVTGRVEVELQRIDDRRPPHRRTRRALIESDGSFKTTLRACRPGDYRAFAAYPGSGEYEPMKRTRLGSRVTQKGC